MSGDGCSACSNGGFDVIVIGSLRFDIGKGRCVVLSSRYNSKTAVRSF